jgi:hypothetical protein
MGGEHRWGTKKSFGGNKYLACFAILDFEPLICGRRPDVVHVDFNCPMAYIYILASNDRAYY